MTLFRKWHVAGLLAPLLIVLLAGCTTGHHGASASDPGALTWGMSVEPGSLDPAQIPDLYTGELLAHVFEGLTRVGADNHIEPALAEKWDISPDGKTYTFHLRRGVRFHNGRELTAEDFKYSWERALWHETNSTVAANYLEGVVGVAEMAAGKRRDLPGVRVVDAQTLEVTLDRPRAYFLGMLTYTSNSVVCRESIEKNGGKVDAKALIGTGPFTLESYQAGQKIALKANPDYWDGKPKIAHVVEPILVIPETEYNNFESGALDIMPDVPVTRYDQDRRAGRFASEYHLLPFASFNYLVMQIGRVPAFAKLATRQAFAMAINREEIVKIAMKGVGKVADGVLPPELPDIGPLPPAIPYDPAKAKQLLAQSGYPNGKGFPSLTLNYVQNNPTAAAMVEIIRKNLADNLGVNVSLQEREFAQFVDDGNHDKMDFYLAAWAADYPDPQDFVSTLFTSTASMNHTGYKNPQFDALCAQADAERDETKRAALYGQANKLIMQDVGVLPILFAPRISLVHANVQGWRANLCSFLPNTLTTKTAR